MDGSTEICCSRCGQALKEEQVHALRGVTGMSVEQLAQYNLRLYCERCETGRKRKMGRVGVALLLVLFVCLVVLLVV